MVFALFRRRDAFDAHESRVIGEPTPPRRYSWLLGAVPPSGGVVLLPAGGWLRNRTVTLLGVKGRDGTGSRPTLPMKATSGHTSSTVDRVANSRGMYVRELACTVAGASAGSFVRYGVDQMWQGLERALMPTLVLTAAAAMLIGFALVASLRAPIKTVLIAAGGAAGSISAAATQAASATPAQSIVGLATFFVSAVAGVLLGMLVTFSVLRNAQREERC